MTSSPSAEITRVACLTPVGGGAIATLAVRGPGAWSIVRDLFRIGRAPGKALPAEASVGKRWLGRLGETPGSACADEVVLVVKRAPPACWLELHCHGGPEAVRFLLEILAARGAHACSWQELERLTADDAGQAAALAVLVNAPTVRTAAILLDQYHGAFTRSVKSAHAALAGGELLEGRLKVEMLGRYASLGRHLIVPWQVVVAGPPNVGKSSLVNALAGFQRSVVAATPGTTRDVVTTLIAIDGWPVELADTAGIRSPAEALETMGIERARMAVDEADLCLWVLDASAPQFPPDPAPSLRYVVNKIDLPAMPGFVAPAGAVSVSAALGTGLDALCGALAGWLVPNAPSPGAAVPFTGSLCDRVEEASQLCAAGAVAETLRVLEKLLSASGSSGD